MKNGRTIETIEELQSELKQLQVSIRKAKGLKSVDLTKKIDVVLFKLGNR